MIDVCRLEPPSMARAFLQFRTFLPFFMFLLAVANAADPAFAIAHNCWYSKADAVATDDVGPRYH